MKLFKKAALAVVISTIVAAPAVANDLDFSGTGETIVLADVIFGNGNPGTGSEETLITAPEVTFDLDADANEGDNGTIASVATIKFTLGGGAVFGEDLSTTAAVDASNGGLGAFSLTTLGGTLETYEVVQGGAIGDNTITFELTFVADGNVIEAATFGGYAVKNLTSALNPSSSSKRVRLGVEYVESIDDAPDDIASTATDTPLTIFGSQAPVDLTANAVDFDTTVRINVGNSEKTFTDTNSDLTDLEDGRNDFLPAGDVSTVNLGTLQLALEAADLVTFVNASGNVRKENGDDFDFQGGDDHTLSFTVGSGSLQEGSTIFLNANPDCATGTPFSSNTISDTETTGFNLAVTGTTTQLTTEYNLCYSVMTGANADTIPEVGQINATWNIDFFNQRFDNVAEEAGPFGDLVRNGCIASFFNVPAVGNADTAYIRLTNTSNTNAGDIRGTIYAQDGAILGEDVTIAPDLAIHATQVFSTEGANRTTASGEEIIDIETAFGIDGADYKGRARLVLKGAFDTCEGLGLLRTGDGSLFNMTATTQGNEAAAPNDGNNGN